MDIMITPHLFIVGNPLSGSSMLYRLLSYHRDLAWFSQWTLRDGSTGPERKKIPFAYLLNKTVNFGGEQREQYNKVPF